MDYPCTSCSQCCRRIGELLEGSYDYSIFDELVRRFPYKAREDGACEMLTDEGKCSVYETRPLLCNIKMGGYAMRIPQREWYRMNQEGCNRMVREAGMGNEYLVVLDF